MEVDRVERDELGRGEEGVEVYLAHRAGDAIGSRGGAHKPAVTCQCVVDVLADADGACLVEVWVLGVASLEVDKDMIKINMEYNSLLQSTHPYLWCF